MPIVFFDVILKDILDATGSDFIPHVFFCMRFFTQSGNLKLLNSFAIDICNEHLFINVNNIYKYLHLF